MMKTQTKTMTAAEFLAALPASLNTEANCVADVLLAKTIRTECAQAVACGALPPNTKVSVRINHHNSLTVEIVAWEGRVLTDEYAETIMNPAIKWEPEYRSGRRHQDARLCPELNAAIALVETIAERHNYDKSDSMVDHFDVGYYLDVDARTVISIAETGIRLESDPAFAALVEQAMIAAKALGPKVVRSICGKRGVNGCGQWALERLIKVAAKANGRELVYDKHRSTWIAKAA